MTTDHTALLGSQDRALPPLAHPSARGPPTHLGRESRRRRPLAPGPPLRAARRARLSWPSITRMVRRRPSRGEPTGGRPAIAEGPEGVAMAGVMPLDDVRVIDLTRYTAGPFCTRLLADYGADVVKVEPPGGEPTSRALPPFARRRAGSGAQRPLPLPQHRQAQRGAGPEGGAPTASSCSGLVRDADVLVENFRPGAMERLGLGYERLSEVNPRLVMTSITNFGQDGPYRDFQALDITLLRHGRQHDRLLRGHGPRATEDGRPHGQLPRRLRRRARRPRPRCALVESARRGRAPRREHLRDGDAVDRHAPGAADGPPVQRPARLPADRVPSAVGSGVYPCQDGFFLFTGRRGPAARR